MGLLSPNKEECRLMQKMFEERARVVGIEGYYYEVKNLNIDELSRIDRMEHFSPVKISFIFEEMPNPKTLRNLKWWDDNDDTTPPIAYLPWHVDEERNYELKPSVGAYLEVPDPLSQYSRFFEIQEINANSLFLVNTIVKLSPARFTSDKTIVTDERKDNKVKKEGTTDYELISP